MPKPNQVIKCRMTGKLYIVEEVKGPLIRYYSLIGGLGSSGACDRLSFDELFEVI